MVIICLLSSSLRCSTQTAETQYPGAYDELRLMDEVLRVLHDARVVKRTIPNIITYTVRLSVCLREKEYE